MNKFFLPTLLLLSSLPVVATTTDANKIIGHTPLQQAIRDNIPPSGYIDLSYCDSVQSIGELPVDRKTYSLSFDKNFIFNPDNGELSTVVNTTVLHTQMVGRTPVLSSLPATVIVSSVPKSPYLRYQVSLNRDNATSMRTYMCDWQKAVYLWKQS